MYIMIMPQFWALDSYILVTVHALYDEAVYLSDQEYQEKVGQAIHKGYVYNTTLRSHTYT